MIHKRVDIEADKQIASLTTYILDNSKEIDEERTRPLVMICPGGAYRFVSDREAEPIAIRMNAMGFHACVLRYSVYPAKFPTALVQLAKSVAYVREHAQEWNVNKDKIIVAGFSAGGHLAASLGTMWKEKFLEDILQMPGENYKPNGMILSYPVITSREKTPRDSLTALLQEDYDNLIDKMSINLQVSEATPPAFIWHTFTDNVVPLEHSLLLSEAMYRKNIPFELHIYPNGVHGLALASEETKAKNYSFGIQTECQNWIDMAGNWIRNLS